jgi:outer membrane lipopolysaccharide assembly protein LptE/RlpB
MNKLLKGNFDVKRKVEVTENKDEEATLANEFRRKALESIGGSMVFVEREKLFWEDTDSAEGK